MDDDRDIVELSLEESNELSFKIVVQGANEKPSSYRLVCEASEYSYAFNGHRDDDGNVTFMIPSLKGAFQPEQIYECAVEVLVEGRFFRPLRFGTKFKQPLKCMVESVQVKNVVSDDAINISVERKPPVKKAEVAPISFELSARPITARPGSLREKFERKQSVTGIDEKTMEEIAKSTLSKLSKVISKDSDNKGNK